MKTGPLQKVLNRLPEWSRKLNADLPGEKNMDGAELRSGLHGRGTLFPERIFPLKQLNGCFHFSVVTKSTKKQRDFDQGKKAFQAIEELPGHCGEGIRAFPGPEKFLKVSKN